MNPDMRKRAEEIVWPEFRDLFTVICPRCSGIADCSFCEGMGWIYVNQSFENKHKTLVKVITDALRSVRMEALDEAEELIRLKDLALQNIISILGEKTCSVNKCAGCEVEITEAVNEAKVALGGGSGS